LLIYWGCGEHAPPGQPFVLDFSNIGPDQPIPQMPRMIDARPERPPSPETSATYGVWPNERSRTTVPPSGSLVGHHTVQGDYSPQIDFTLGPDHDFLGPLNLSAGEKTPAGATRLTWASVGGATGYFAFLVGGGDRGNQGTSAVMWSSAESPSMGGALMDYLPPGEVRRLIAERAVLPPTTTECLVPAEVSAAIHGGFVQMIAYGDEATFADPPRPKDPRTPWNLKWTVKVRFKSTAGAVLGMNMPANRGAPPSGNPYGQGQAPPPSQPSATDRAGQIMRGLGGFGGFLP
jgi:hypothetical protein